MAEALRAFLRFFADYPFVTHCLAPLSDRPIVPRDNCARGPSALWIRDPRYPWRNLASYVSEETLRRAQARAAEVADLDDLGVCLDDGCRAWGFIALRHRRPLRLPLPHGGGAARATCRRRGPCRSGSGPAACRARAALPVLVSRRCQRRNGR